MPFLERIFKKTVFSLEPILANLKMPCLSCTNWKSGQLYQTQFDKLDMFLFSTESQI